MAENKTKPTRASVAGFLKGKATGEQLADSKLLVKLFSDVTGKPGRMWGPSIVGFGSYHYLYESGREGDAPLLAFSPRKPATVLYLSPGDDGRTLLKKLGKYKSRGGCLYVKRLADIDMAVLRKLAQLGVKTLKQRYPD